MYKLTMRQIVTSCEFVDLLFLMCNTGVQLSIVTQRLLLFSTIATDNLHITSSIAYLVVSIHNGKIFWSALRFHFSYLAYGEYAEWCSDSAIVWLLSRSDYCLFSCYEALFLIFVFVHRFWPQWIGTKCEIIWSTFFTFFIKKLKLYLLLVITLVFIK